MFIARRSIIYPTFQVDWMKDAGMPNFLRENIENVRKESETNIQYSYLEHVVHKNRKQKHVMKYIKRIFIFIFCLTSFSE